MGKSYRKEKIFPNAGSSEKKDKQLANRKFRRKKADEFNEDELPLDLDEVSNKWGMSKDGKHYWKDATKRNMSK